MTSWTDDRVTRLKRLRLEGHSASAVARQLGGVTRNAVIGKVHRLGLSGRVQPSAPVHPPHPNTRPVQRARRPALVVVGATLPKPVRAVSPAEPAPAGPRTPLLRLSACSCRFGLGDPRDETFGFCGAPRVRGPYCAQHAEIAYQPPAPTRLEADRRLLELMRRTG